MTYKSDKALTKRQIINSILTSSGYPLSVSKDEYEKHNPFDKVVFNKIMFDDEYLTATLINKERHPREMYVAKGVKVDYTFTVRFNAEVELNLKDTE